MTQDQRGREIDSFNHGKNLLVVKIPLLKKKFSNVKSLTQLPDLKVSGLRFWNKNISRLACCHFLESDNK
jgi:hypothetical protein